MIGIPAESRTVQTAITHVCPAQGEMNGEQSRLWGVCKTGREPPLHLVSPAGQESHTTSFGSFLPCLCSFATGFNAAISNELLRKEHSRIYFFCDKFLVCIPSLFCSAKAQKKSHVLKYNKKRKGQ